MSSPHVRLGMLEMCKDCVIVCPFLPQPLQSLSADFSPSSSASWLPVAVYLQAAPVWLCFFLWTRKNHTPSVFSTMPLLKVVPFSDLPGVGRNSTDLKCYVPCNWISLSFPLFPYLSLFPCPQESYPKIVSQHKVFSRSVATLGAHSWFLLAPWTYPDPNIPVTCLLTWLPASEIHNPFGGG